MNTPHPAVRAYQTAMTFRSRAQALRDAAARMRAAAYCVRVNQPECARRHMVKAHEILLAAGIHRPKGVQGCLSPIL